MMKFILLWAIGILIPTIGLHAQEVIDDMVIYEGTSLMSSPKGKNPLKKFYCLFLLPEQPHLGKVEQQAEAVVLLSAPIGNATYMEAMEDHARRGLVSISIATL